MRTHHCISIGIVLLLPISLAAESARPRQIAQNNNSDKDRSNAKQAEKSAVKASITNVPSKSKAPIPIIREREEAVMDFVKQHHSELAELLINLKESNSKEYDRAVRDLLRVSERLSQTQSRDPARYEIELKLWQAQSRIDLLAARLKMSNGEDLRNQLREGLTQKLDLRQALLELDRNRAAERLRKVDEQLSDLNRSRPELIEKQLNTLVGNTDKTVTKPTTKGSNKAANKSSNRDVDKRKSTIENKSEKALPK